MCTVSFISIKDKCFITSNRDEKNSRKQAVPPDVYQFESGKLVYPKDGDAGGSWIALHENGNAAVLLNGAFEKHSPRSPHGISRGIVLLDVLASGDPVRKFDHINLEKIEPFTLVIVDKKDLYECRWDSHRKYFRHLRNYRPYIWSSVTLYSDLAIKKREQWFETFLGNNPDPAQDDILRFHQFAGDGDKNNDIQMERSGLYATVSITSILVTANQGTMKYLDLSEEKMYGQRIDFTSECEIL